MSNAIDKVIEAARRCVASNLDDACDDLEQALKQYDAAAIVTTKCCGSCRWYTDYSVISGFDSGEGLCGWWKARMPSAYPDSELHTFSRQGTTCPTWKPLL